MDGRGIGTNGSSSRHTGHAIKNGHSGMHGEGEQKKRQREKGRDDGFEEVKSKKSKKDRSYPELHFNLNGFKGAPVTVGNVRDLVLWILADGTSPGWMKVQNKQNLKRIVALHIPGIDAESLELEETPTNRTIPIPMKAVEESDTLLIPTMHTLFSHACPTRAAGDRARVHSPVATFLNCRMSDHEKVAFGRERQSQGQVPGANARSYLLTLQQFKEAAYPCPSYLCEKEDEKLSGDWIETPKGAGARLDDQARVFGMDCEMCMTSQGSELTRVSLVDFQSGEIIYDKMVRPAREIVDYLTKYSGLTAAKLLNVTTTLRDVQSDLKEMINYNTILIGHSLECDLRVLKLAHPHVIDTSVIFQHTRGPPYKPSLKWLAQKWLDRRIQLGDSEQAANGDYVGHDSTEDARAAVDLVKLKLEKGPSFGEFIVDMVPIFTRLEANHEPKYSAIADHGNPSQWYGTAARTCVPCKTDDQVERGLLANLESHQFLFGRFTELSQARKWSQQAPQRPVDAPTTEDVDDLKEGDDKGLDDLPLVYARLNDRLSRIHDGLPKGTVLIIFTGTADPRRMAEYQAKRTKLTTMTKTIPQSEIPSDVFTENDSRILEAEVVKTRMGLSFFCVK